MILSKIIGIKYFFKRILFNTNRKEEKVLKATGIVRRIDDLGRVVIPKEIRRTMRIREGDPLEIYTENDGEVIFKKYSPVGELSHFANQFSEILSKSSGYPVLIADRDAIVSSFGITRKDVVDRKISEELEAILELRKTFVYDGSNSILAAEGIDKAVAVAVPILAAGDLAGTVILLLNDIDVKPGESEIKLTQSVASFLAKQMEE
jgi:AbrB family transcriptional regulator (stage V sporulation protein T)